MSDGNISLPESSLAAAKEAGTTGPTPHCARAGEEASAELPGREETLRLVAGTPRAACASAQAVAADFSRLAAHTAERRASSSSNSTSCWSMMCCDWYRICEDASAATAKTCVTSVSRHYG